MFARLYLHMFVSILWVIPIKTNAMGFDSFTSYSSSYHISSVAFLHIFFCVLLAFSFSKNIFCSMRTWAAPSTQIETVSHHELSWKFPEKRIQWHFQTNSTMFRLYLLYRIRFQKHFFQWWRLKSEASFYIDKSFLLTELKKIHNHIHTVVAIFQF